MKAAFFDRDGTLNVDKDYLYKIEAFEWIEGAREALAYLAEQGYTIFVITNQSGIARGYYTEADMHKLHAYMNETLADYGVKIEKFYFCPHHPEGPVPEYTKACNCRKPKPGMYLQACAEFPVDKAQSFAIGDKKRDVESAEAAGIKGYLYEGGSLLEAVKKIVEG